MPSGLFVVPKLMRVIGRHGLSEADAHGIRIGKRVECQSRVKGQDLPQEGKNAVAF
jgi:hypothetical protein